MSVVFERHERGASVLYGACADIWSMIVFAPPTKADLLLSRASLATMTRAYPRGFPTLTWVLPEAGVRMDGPTRRVAADVTREFDQRILAQATLVEGRGFQVAAVRAIVGSIDLLTRHKSPKRVFSDTSLAVAWCLERRAPGASPGREPFELALALGSVRDTLVSIGEDAHGAGSLGGRRRVR